MTRALPRLLLVVVLLAACTAGGEDPAAETDGGAQADVDEEAAAEPASEPTLQPAVQRPEAATTVVDGEAPQEGALTVVEELFTTAPLVVLASSDDVAAQVAAASIAVDVGAPLLLVAPSPAEQEPVRSALDGLDTEVVVAVGAAGAFDPGDRDVLRLSSDSDAVAEALGREPGDARAVSTAEAVAALTDAGTGEAPLLELEAPSEGEVETEGGDGAEAESADGAEPADEPDADATETPAPQETPSPEVEADDPSEVAEVLARHERPDVPDELDLLVVDGEDGEDGEDGDLAAVASALAAGADPLVLEDPDPRATSTTVQAVAERSPEHVLAVGDFDEAERLRDRLDVAATGVELPGGGQVLLPHRRFVALYGHPASTVLGALGEQGLDATLDRAREVAAPYEALSEIPVIPTFEIITTIASASPAPQGDYSIRTEIDVLRPHIDAAAEHGFYVVLDLQPGRTDFLTQAQEYEELLLEPHVGLALDPEWRLGPDQVHMRQIGGVEADEVNQVVDWLADLTRENDLPQKLLVLHQFKFSMLPDRERIDFTRDELAVLIHMDGNGTPGMKRETWAALTEEAPAGSWWGWKNFYDEDDPTFTPQQTLEVAPPDPLFISYQ